MARFRPAFCLTCLPCCSLLPFDDLDMFVTCKSSIHTSAWFWLTAVLALCRKSLRALAIRL